MSDRDLLDPKNDHVFKRLFGEAPDFDLFADGPAQSEQALWRFEMRDARQPAVTLGNVLQLNLIELKKADRLGLGPGPLGGWVAFFAHWREEQTMARVQQAPIQQALCRVRELSADAEARRLAFVRERALHDEATLLKEAREEGRQEGREEGRQTAARETARNLIELKVLSDGQIAQATGLTVAQIEALRSAR